jgi:hypothetical protein
MNKLTLENSFGENIEFQLCPCNLITKTHPLNSEPQYLGLQRHLAPLHLSTELWTTTGPYQVPSAVLWSVGEEGNVPDEKQHADVLGLCPSDNRMLFHRRLQLFSPWTLFYKFSHEGLAATISTFKLTLVIFKKLRNEEHYFLEYEAVYWFWYTVYTYCDFSCI